MELRRGWVIGFEGLTGKVLSNHGTVAIPFGFATRTYPRSSTPILPRVTPFF